MKNFLEGCEKQQDGRYRIHETINLIPKKEKINETVLIEGKETKATSKYTFLIWDDNFNANGRNYKNVIDRVIDDNRTTITLTNHPNDEIDMGKANGVAKNPRKLENGWMAVDWYPADCEDGKRFASIFDLGGPISVSSSVLGNLDENGFVQNDDSFELERYFDIVDSPSNRIYHYKDKVENHDDEGGFHTISENGIEESITIFNDDSTSKVHTDNEVEKGENIMENNAIAEASLKMNLRSMLKEADNTSDLYAKKEILESAHLYAKSLPTQDLANEIAEKISTNEAEIKTLSEKGLKTNELEESIKLFDEKVKTLEEENVSLKEENAKLEKQLKAISTLYESKQYEASETELLKNKRLAKEVCSLKIKARKLENSIKTLTLKNKMISEKLIKSEAIANSKVDVADYVLMKDKLSISESHNVELVNRVKSLRKDVLNEARKPSRFDFIKNRVITEKKAPAVVQKSESNENFDEEEMAMEKLLRK